MLFSEESVLIGERSEGLLGLSFHLSDCYHVFCHLMLSNEVGKNNFNKCLLKWLITAHSYDIKTLLEKVSFPQKKMSWLVRCPDKWGVLLSGVLISEVSFSQLSCSQVSWYKWGVLLSGVLISEVSFSQLSCSQVSWLVRCPTLRCPLYMEFCCKCQPLILCCTKHSCRKHLWQMYNKLSRIIKLLLDTYTTHEIEEKSLSVCVKHNAFTA